jgi:tight adherence protein C
MALIISILFFLALTGSITLYGYRRYARPGRFFEQLGGPATAITMPGIDRVSDDEPGLIVKVVQQIGEQLPVSPEDAAVTRRDLIAAGYRSESAATVVYGAKILSCIALIALAIAVRDLMPASAILRNVLLVAAGWGGYLLPGFYLEHLVTARQERLRFGLPDALDLMVISVEAGLALDQAIQHVSRELFITHRDISEEFALVNLEMRAGKRRSEALRNLAERTNEKELRKLIAILIQTDKFGTSVADSLRTHSDFMRVRRRQEAEERAGKVGVKLVFPIFFFIMPAMMIVAAGPGLLQVFKFLVPMMKNFKSAL